MQAEAIEAEALRRSDELKTALLRSVSHDLRTPLTSIIAAGAALDSPSVSAAERHELSEAVVEQGKRLSRLVENLLDISRLEAGKCRAPPRAGRAGRAARGGPRLDRPDGELGSPRPRRRPAGLDADPTQLERAFANLLENARPARRAASRSRSALAAVGPRLIVRVIDRGPGIPESERERIFEPFHRVTGVARRRAPASGWRSPRASSRPTAARSRSSRCPARGRSFVVTLPRAAEERQR